MCFLSKEMSRRLYVGGLFHGVSEDEVKDRFGKFGSISNVSIKEKQDGNGNSKSLCIHSVIATTCC